MRNWTPVTEGLGFEFTPTLKPLEPFRDSMTVISGLNVAKNAGASLHSQGQHALAHRRASEGCSGSSRSSCRNFDGPSRGEEFGQDTQFSSLEVSLEPNDFVGSCDPGFSCAYINTVSWRGPTTPLPMEHNPRVVFEQLFGDAGTTDAAARWHEFERTRACSTRCWKRRIG